MKAATFLIVVTTLLLTGCSGHGDDDPPQQATAAHVSPRVEMSGMAEQVCSNAGGTLALSRQLDGSSVGMCQLANGRRCGENALVSGSCVR
ncbi:DUF333 domain-containing protein [Erwinia mallotivora]|uniref:putative hemolysin n=1 Tax=Erwinia mallotivora TaxID=69222 RepID=UPI0035E7EDAA